MSPRAFRTPESYYAEQISRSMIIGYLSERGFTNIRDERNLHGNVESQTIHATAPDGSQVTMRVRLCWRRRKSSDTYAAAQILPKIRNDDWEGTLRHKFERESGLGVTHTLFIQREEDMTISHAAMIPQSEIVSIWCAQRDTSKALIAEGKLGRRKKNHAMNGSSPTLWLYDEKAPEVTAVLWEHAGVVDLTKLEVVQKVNEENQDDTYDDLPGIDYSLLGSDGGDVTRRLQSQVKRDQRVRKNVISRAERRCENAECGVERNYPGFLDVHHILGVGTSDRVWNCVALCPNCHREAHASPNRDAINAHLLSYASCYKPAGES